ncbi:MAG: hypothetical protein C0475_00405 [Planctomyces sp.]|nr:hypothetical protein [Planctomyces sp.]
MTINARTIAPGRRGAPARVAPLARLTAGALPAVLACAAWPQGNAAPTVADAAPPVALRAPEPLPEIDPSQVTGRDFAGVRLPETPVDGALVFRAARVRAWAVDPEPGPRPGTTIGDRVQRLLLEGDVRVGLGPSEYSAARAVVWLEPLSGPAQAPRLWQAAVYFDRVSDPRGEPGASIAADRLLLTATLRGEVLIGADALVEADPAGDPFLAEAHQRLADRLLDLLLPEAADGPRRPDTPALSPSLGSSGSAPISPGQSQPFEPDSALTRPTPLAGLPSALDTDRQGPGRAIFAPRGVITIAAPSLVPLVGGADNASVATGGVTVQYTEPASDRSLLMSAERAVIFLAEGEPPELLRQPAGSVEGVYLEGNVSASDGRFNLRGQRVYYDVRRNQAVVLDAVFWTFDEARGLPFYARAKTLRQTATNSAVGRGVTLGTSAFFRPHLSLGASQVTITRRARPGGEARTFIQGQGITARAVGVPFLYLPAYSGTADRPVLKAVSARNSSGSGFGVVSRWDVLALMGLTPEEGDYRVDGLLEVFDERGFAAGLDAAWNQGPVKGSLFAYIVPSDEGTDVLPSGTRVDNDGLTRGFVDFRHQWTIDPNWDLFLQGAFFSDANALPAFFPERAQTDPEYTNAINLRYIDGVQLFSVQARQRANDFLVNQFLVQSTGFSTARVPEAFYTRVGDDLLGGLAPGLLTYSSESRVGRVRLQFNEATASELGFLTDAEALDAIGGLPSESSQDILLAAGFTDENIARADTRHQFDFNLDLGPVKLQPFLVGRATAYDDRFSDFAPGQDRESFRLYGAIGVNASTQYARVYDGVDFPGLDVHRLRHIVQPSITAVAAGGTRPAGTLPIFDDTVEGVADGAFVRAGVRNVFQTRRGGVGRERSVDFVTVNTNLILANDTATRRSPVGRFFDFRPEDSLLGNFFAFDLTWQVTDAVAVTASNLYDLDTSDRVRTVVGVRTEHSQNLSTFLEVRDLEVRDTTFLRGGADLRISENYVVTLSGTLDLAGGEAQEQFLSLARDFPGLRAIVSVGFNNVTDETSIGVTFRPVLEDARSRRIQRLSPDPVEAALQDPARPAGIPGAL